MNAQKEALFDITDLGYCRYYRWLGDPLHRVYETVPDKETDVLTADELREAIASSAAVLRDVDTGELVVFQPLAMEEVRSL